MPLGRCSGRVEVDVAEWLTGAVQEVLPAQRLALFGGAWVALADGLVELDRLGPPVRVVVADPPPARVSVEWASYCEYPVTITRCRVLRCVCGVGGDRLRAVLSVRLNDVAIRALGLAGLTDAVPSVDLVPELRGLVAEGVVRRGEALVFARHADRADAAPGNCADLTGWECSVSSFHLDDVVPVQVGLLADGEPVISEDDQLLMLRHGLGFAIEVVRLVRELPEPVAVRCVVGANSTNGTFRFHRARPGESWLNADLDSYLLDKLIVVDSGPSSLGRTPW